MTLFFGRVLGIPVTVRLKRGGVRETVECKRNGVREAWGGRGVCHLYLDPMRALALCRMGSTPNFPQNIYVYFSYICARAHEFEPVIQSLD